MSTPTAIGYLVGSGSMSLGIEAAGFELQEIWETSGYSKNARSWDLNRPAMPHRVLELDHTSDHFAQRRGLDLIYGNPPCGGVSNMTQGGVNNKTNACMRHWLRMVVKGQPRLILMESGYQLDTPKYEKLLADLTGVLDTHDYYWWTWQFFSYQVGTPQIRRRMFLCASLDAPVHDCWLDLTDLLLNAKRIVPRAYLEPLEAIEPSPDPVTLADGTVAHNHWWNNEGKACSECVPGNRWRFVQKGSYVTPKQLVTFRRMAEQRADQKSLKDYERARRALWEDCPKPLDYSAFFKRLAVMNYDEPAHTMIGVYKFVHPTIDRLLTMREMAQLMGYPMSWRFTSNDPHYAIQGVPAGNSRWAADRMLRVIGER